LPVIYDGEKLDLGYRVDLLVENQVVVEINCVEALHPVHHAQLLSYMRLSGKSVGVLINFYVAHLRDGIKRMAGTQRAGNNKMPFLRDPCVLCG